MKGIVYGIYLQWKLDLRNKSRLVSVYLIPLLFFALMGGLFTSLMPEMKQTLIGSMIVFGVSLAALNGLPPSLAEIYHTDIRKMYLANGVPLRYGLIVTNVSAFIHLFIVSMIIYGLAPIMFDARLPEDKPLFFGALALFIIVSLQLANVIGLLVKDQGKVPLVSSLFFLPSIMLSGIMFDAELLPKALLLIGKFFPAFWGFRMMTRPDFCLCNLQPQLILLALTILLTEILLDRLKKE